ncbi:YbaN family protein (plasmid) [Thermus thermophilus]|uniref:Inner membrane protein YbaN n=1 Tax=Thermus thermophilus TaxID=274 RepID=A0A3P4AUH1_THETH|nr:YbaN family protein [Thermus thermophilus]BDG27513.1 hypothetical protein TthSNM66_21490 [Thermus thermophilus]VCU54785.1 Inner membrane protein YbaN [Thermus thermophilus]
MRVFFLGLGFAFAGLGFLGIFLPILPATPFFLVGAYFFSKSHPRLEAWLLSLPQVGPLVQNYRAGRGVPRRTKLMATGVALAAAAFSAYGLPHPLVKGLVLLLVAYGVYFLWKRVPTLTPGKGLIDQDFPEGQKHP